MKGSVLTVIKRIFSRFGRDRVNPKHSFIVIADDEYYRGDGPGVIFRSEVSERRSFPSYGKALRWAEKRSIGSRTTVYLASPVDNPILAAFEDGEWVLK